MCGRFYLDASEDELQDFFGLSAAPAVTPRYNIESSQSILAVTVDADGREGRWFHWGLIPSWAKDQKFGYRTINVRVETVAGKPAFRAAFKRRRCLIPASGYFEWHVVKQGKQPYCIRSSEAPLLALAGLYEHWQSPRGEAIESCAIIVGEATPELAAVHNRMPICLDPDQFDTWLDPQIEDIGLLKRMLARESHLRLTLYPVTPRMNDPRFASWESIQPLVQP
jgi:putative SOS response-associated peptidase YedK